MRKILLALVSVLAVHSRHVQVRLDGDDGDCSSDPSKPCSTIKHAVKVAESNKIDSIIVQDGTYSAKTGGNVNITVSVDIAAVNGQVVVDCAGEAAAWSLAVQSSSNYRISGFHFKNCTPSETWRGYGPKCKDWCQDPWGSHVPHCNCCLSPCTRGAALTVFTDAPETHDSFVLLQNSTFQACNGDKGAVQLALFSKATRRITFQVENCIFTESRAKSTGPGGSALDILFAPAYAINNVDPEQSYLLESSSVNIVGSSFTNNSGTQSTVMFLGTAGLMQDFNISLSSSSFVKNGHVGAVGGALSYFPATPFNTSSNIPNTLFIDSVEFRENRAKVAGAILTTNPMMNTTPGIPFSGTFYDFKYLIHILIQKSKFISNVASNEANDFGQGGAYAISNGNHTFIDCIFENNYAALQGGALCFGCGGGGDAALRLENCRFVNNTALKGSTFSSWSSGRHVFRNTTFQLTGSSKGSTDFEAEGIGQFEMDENTSLTCSKNSYLLRPDNNKTTFSVVSSGILNPIWDGTGTSVYLNFGSVSCLECLPGTYNIFPTVLSGPLQATVSGPGQPVSQTPGKLRGRNTCYACPFGGVCNISDRDVWGQSGFYGHVCRDDGSHCEFNQSKFDASVNDNITKLRFLTCPNGLCKDGKWSESCIETRTGLLCTRCKEGYSEALGQNACVPNKNCTILLLIPMLAVMIAYAAYVYSSSANKTYNFTDMTLLYYQMVLFVLSDAKGVAKSFVLRLAGYMSLNFASLSADHGSFTVNTCVFSGLSPVNRMCLGYAGCVLFLVLVLLTHLLNSRVLPSTCRLEAANKADALPKALTKAYLAIYSSLLGTTAHLLQCVRLPGYEKLVLFRAADVQCYTFWQKVGGIDAPIIFVSVLIPCAVMAPYLRDRLPRFLVDKMKKVKDLEMEVFHEGYWAAAYVFAMLRGVFALIPTLWASDASSSVTNAMVLVILLGLSVRYQPFKEERMQLRQTVLLILLAVISITSLKSSLFSTAGIPDYQVSESQSIVALDTPFQVLQIIALGAPLLFWFAAYAVPVGAPKVRQWVKRCCFKSEAGARDLTSELVDHSR